MTAPDRRRTSGRGRPAIGTLLLVAAASLASLGAMAGDGGVEKIDGARSTLEQWVETRRIIAREKRDWTVGREMLEQRIDLMQREIADLRSKIADARASIDQADKSRVELQEQNETLKTATAALPEVVLALETGTRELLERVPEPIRDRVKPLSQQFPEDLDDVKLSLAQRFQNVIGVLNELNKFNREITLTSEVRTLPGGKSAEVTALYVGIGQAYYANADGTIAGVGTAGDEGWVWTPANEAGPQIARAIAIMKNEEVAQFVRLPVTVR